MKTVIYGASDDLIEADGDFSGEFSCYGTDDNKHGLLLIISDGTILEIQYGKLGQGIWGIKVHREGPLFDKISFCSDENDEIYSDQVFMKQGVSSILICTEWYQMD